MMPRSSRLTPTLVVLFVVGASCSPADLATTGRSPAAAQAPMLLVEPSTTETVPGGVVQFAAAAYGSRDGGVQWSVAESAGGSVDAQGRYTAPARSGTFHVVVTSATDGALTATATVTVSDAAAPGAPAGQDTTAAAGGSAAATGTASDGASPAATPAAAITSPPLPPRISDAWSFEEWQSRFLDTWPGEYSGTWLPMSRRGDSGYLYWLGYGIDAATTAFLAGIRGPDGQSPGYYIDQALTLAENMMSSATEYPGVSGYPGSPYRGWWIDGSQIGSGVWAANLGEWSGWRHVTRLLRVVYQSASLAAYVPRASELLAFSELHVFQKWWTFQNGGTNTRPEGGSFIYRDFATTAMAAQVALDLWLVTSDATWKPRYQAVWETLNSWSTLDQGCITASSSYDGASTVWFLPSHGSVDLGAVMDIDHSGQFLSYFVEAYSQQAGWSDADVAGLVKMFTTAMWRSGSASWTGRLDGSGSVTSGGSAVHVGDSIAPLAMYDSELQAQLEAFVEGQHFSLWRGANLYAHGAFNNGGGR